MQSLSLAKLKEFAALRANKNRAQMRLFLCEGRKLVQEALAARWPLAAVLATEAAAAAWPELLAAAEAATQVLGCRPADLARISTQEEPDGWLAVARLPDAPPSPPPMAGPAFVLRQVQDPGNLGTLLRIADWFGHRQLYCSADTVAWHNPKVVRAAMGAVFRVPVVTLPDLDARLAEQAAHVAAAVLSGPPPEAVLSAGRSLILLGNESHGLPPELLTVPHVAHVSIAGGGGAESLNVAVAGGILAYALHRQLNG